MGVIVNDHEGFQKTVARAVLAGAGAATLAAVFGRWGGWPAAAVWLGGPVGMGMAAALGGVFLARGVEGLPRKLLASGLGALGAVCAATVGRFLFANGTLAFLPTGIEALLIGCAGGFVVGVSSIGRHLERLSAPAEAPDAIVERKIAGLLERAEAAHRKTMEAIGDAVGKDAEVARRLTELDRKIEGCEDPVVRAELEGAREALRAQLACLEEIARGRERALARVMHQVATLERLRLTAIRHRSADAARLGSELQPAVDELADAGAELDLAAEALSEI
jgi:hypothetical protein